MNGRWALRTVIGIVILCAWVPVASAEEGAPAAQEERTTLDKELDKVWGKERDLRIIQKRAFEKDLRHAVGFYVGVIPSNPFFNYFPVGLRYDYFPMESVAIEVSGAYVPSAVSAHAESIKDVSGRRVLSVDVGDRVQWYAGLNAHWIPIHAKVNILNKKLTSLDLGITAGLGLMGSQVRETEADSWKTRWSYNGAVPFNLQFNLGLGLHWFLTDYLAIRLDYRNYIYPKYPGAPTTDTVTGKKKYPSEWGNNVESLSEISIGLSYLTPAPK